MADKKFFKKEIKKAFELFIDDLKFLQPLGFEVKDEQKKMALKKKINRIIIKYKKK